MENNPFAYFPSRQSTLIAIPPNIRNSCKISENRMLEGNAFAGFMAESPRGLPQQRVEHAAQRQKPFTVRIPVRFVKRAEPNGGK